MRVLFVHDAAALGGAEAHTLGLVQHFVGAGDEVRVWTTLPAFATRLRDAGAAVAVIPSHSDFLEPRRFPGFVASSGLRRHRFLRALRAERRRGLDCVYVSGLPEKLLVSRPAHALGLPLFWAEFAPMTPLEPAWRGALMAWYRRHTKLPTRVFTISRFSFDSLVRDGLFPADRLALTYTGSTLPSELPPATPLDAPGPIIACLSRLVEEKGQRVLVNAMPDVLAAVPDATLALGGEGPDRPVVEHLARELGITDRVRLLGYVESQWALLRAADVFCFPSTWTVEGFGIVSVEAMLLEKPVVTTTVGPIPEVVEDGVTGLCVAPNDPGALAAALIDLLASPDRAAAMGRAGRERAEALFSFERVARDTRAVMSEAL